MKKKMGFLVACAASGAISSFTSVARAGSFVDNFNTATPFSYGGNANYWSSGFYEPTNTGASIYSAGPSGPLILSYTGAVGSSTDGPYMYTPLTNEFNPFSAPLTLTMSAPTAPASNPFEYNLTPSADTIDANTATTYLGIEGNNPTTSSNRLDSGANRMVVELGNTNIMQIVIKDSANATLYNYSNQYASGAPIDSATTTYDVTSMWMYVNGANYANGEFDINFGETYINETTDTTGTWTFSGQLGLGTNPFDLGPAGGGGGGGKTQAQLNAVESGYAGGAAAEMEVLNTANNFNSDEAVPVIQLTDVTPPPAVPEPASLGIVAVGAGLLVRRRRQTI